MEPVRLSESGEVDQGELVALYDSVGWTAYTRDAPALMLAIAKSTYVVSAREDGGKLVGLARGLSDDVAVFYLQDILVHPSMQRRGVGRSLLSSCLDRFAHVRQKVLLTDNDPAQLAFYESFGYRQTGEGPLTAFVRLDG